MPGPHGFFNYFFFPPPVVYVFLLKNMSDFADKWAKESWARRDEQNKYGTELDST